jgi:hypothetical protein
MTENRPRKYKLLRWTGGIIAVLIIILAIGAWYVGTKWKPFLTEKIKEGVYEGSQHLYKLDFSDLHLNVLSGSLSLDSLHLRPDTSVYNALRRKKLAPIHIFDVKMDKLRLTRIGFYTAYLKKRINMNAIILDHASINMIHHHVPFFQDTVQVEKTLYDQISKTLKSVHVRSIKILDADFDYLDGETARVLNSVKHVNINITDVLVDSTSKNDTTRFYYSKNVDFEVAGYKSVTKNKMYMLKVDSVYGSASKGRVSVKGFRMIPMYPEMAFSRKYKTQKDRYDLKFKSIEIRGLDFARINSEGLLYARSVTVGPAKVNIFMNRELQRGTEIKEKFPHLTLQKLEPPLIVDQVLLKNVDIAYAEYNPKSQRRGVLNIDNLRGTLRNLTNDSSRISNHPQMTSVLKARMIKAADLNIRLTFNLKAKDGDFTYKGRVGGFNMTALNPIAESLGLVSIESGNVQKIDFDLRGNKSGVHGNTRMYYSDLKVQLLKKDEDGPTMKKKGLLSFLANTLVINDANPTRDKPLRVSQVNFEREPTSSFFSTLWKGLFSGMREAIGIGGFKTKTSKQSQENGKSKKAVRKEKRQERRENRQKEKQNSSR